MEEWGNGRANEYWEANVPPSVIRPKEGDPVRVVERFIRDKYEFKKYMAKQLPPANERAEEQEERHQDAVARRPSKHHTSHHHGGAHHHHEAHKPAAQQQQPAAASPAPVKVAAPAPSLLDFDEPVSAPAPVQQQRPVQQQQQQAQPAAHDPFAQSTPQRDFDPFASNAPVNQQQSNGFPPAQFAQVTFFLFSL
jgi:stromal membrane-associated protein